MTIKKAIQIKISACNILNDADVSLEEKQAFFEENKESITYALNALKDNNSMIHLEELKDSLRNFQTSVKEVINASEHIEEVIDTPAEVVEEVSEEDCNVTEDFSVKSSEDKEEECWWAIYAYNIDDKENTESCNENKITFGTKSFIQAYLEELIVPYYESFKLFKCSEVNVTQEVKVKCIIGDEI